MFLCYYFNHLCNFETTILIRIINCPSPDASTSKYRQRSQRTEDKHPSYVPTIRYFSKDFRDIKQPLGDCDKRLLQFQKDPLGKLQAASYHRFEHSAWDMSGSKPSNHLEQKLRDILGAYAYQGPEHEEVIMDFQLEIPEQLTLTRRAFPKYAMH
ncbi:hypothetical protein RF11_09264 [Thelohanellus kitauei]|uniref:Uncharacterized protein n=1 Tax=Thelohanellus kitauei TaxID=669202 RepID=A0A0C2IHQ1_THEKT|nr:hypothetical protein RF11_09264 [Thelohanellus kitauei]